MGIGENVDYTVIETLKYLLEKIENFSTDRPLKGYDDTDIE